MKLSPISLRGKRIGPNGSPFEGASRSRIPRDPLLQGPFPCGMFEVAHPPRLRCLISDLKEYANRDALLKSMGFRSYLQYLGSELWARISRQARDRDGRRCRCCKLVGWIVHHDQYDEATLRGETLEHLYTVCPTCHAKIERTETDGKRSLAQARSQLAMMLGRKTPPRAKPPIKRTEAKSVERQRPRSVRNSLVAKRDRLRTQDQEARDALDNYRRGAG